MKNSAAIITGASEGIGREYTELFAGAGYNLVIAARNASKLTEIAAATEAKWGVKVVAVPVDLSSPDGPQLLFDESLKHFDQIKYLVNNAGIGTYGDFNEVPLQQQMDLVDVNIRSLSALCWLGINHMRSSGGGRILNMSSISAFYPGPQMASYHASKSYVLQLSRALHFENRKYNISVTAYCAGPVATQFQERTGTGPAYFAKMQVQSAATAARAGFNAMMKGKAVAMAGFQNNFVTWGSRLVPDAVIIPIVKWMNS